MNSVIYKVVTQTAWRQAETDGVFRGAAIDLQDGYIHFSAAAQLQETIEKHFAGQQDLLLVAVDGDRLGASLKWETSRGGDLFPHLYADLSLAAVIWTATIQ